MSQPIDLHAVFADLFTCQQSRSAAYAVSKKLADGHICVNIETYNNQLKTDRELAVDFNPNYQVAIDLEQLLLSPMVGGNRDIQPLIYHQGNIYLQRYFSYETEIVEQINRLITPSTNSNPFTKELLLEHQSFVLDLFSDHQTSPSQSDEENINWQLTAALTSILSNFSIITGGPGTGKTTAVAKLLALLCTIKPNLRVALAAPTGKAAARMKESLMGAVIRQTNGADRPIRELSSNLTQIFDNLKATTLHRLLGYQPGSHYFKHNQNNPLEFDVIIVDESSMIGASMMAKLLNAVGNSSKIIMLGDKDQLASVEAGSIFGDICLTQKGCMNLFSKDYAEFINQFISDKDAQLKGDFVTSALPSNPLQHHIVELKKSWRFKNSEGIGQFSRAVIDGEIPEELFEMPTTQGQYVMVSDEYESDIFYKLIDYYQNYILEPDIVKALKEVNQVRVLCAVHESDYGVDYYNALIERYLGTKGLILPNGSFYDNQPIMITQNDKTLNLYNGDVGVVRKSGDSYKAYFEDASNEKGYREISTTYLSAYTTVFAMTIHKSQGSEFNHVAVIIPNHNQSQLLTRELIYTAVTRAKTDAIIFSSKEMLLQGVAKQVERASGITNRFINQSN